MTLREEIEQYVRKLAKKNFQQFPKGRTEEAAKMFALGTFRTRRMWEETRDRENNVVLEDYEAWVLDELKQYED